MKILVLILALTGCVTTALLVCGLLPAYLIPAYGVIALAAILSAFPIRPADFPAGVMPCLFTSALFFGYVLVRIACSPFDYIARADLFMVLAALIVYLLTALRATSPTVRVIVISVLLALASAQTFVGAIQFSKGNNFMPFAALPRTDYGARASGFYGCPNHLAGFLEVCLLMSLSLAFLGRWRLPGKILSGYAAVVSLAGLLITGSRGGYGSTLVGLFTLAVLALLSMRRRLRRDAWTLLAAGLVLAAIAAGYTVYSIVGHSDYLSFRVGSTTGDVPVRLSLWKAAIQQWHLSPMFGTGSGTYLYFGRQFREPGVFADPVFAHNDYLHLLAEFGIVGVAALVPFLVMHARSGWLFLAAVASRRTSRWTDEGPGSLRDQSPALIVGALSSLAAFVLHSFVDFNLHIPPNALLLAFIFGLLANPYHDLKPKAPQPARRFAPLFIPAFGLWLACAALPRWPAESLAEKARVLLSDWQYREFPDVSAAAAACARQAIERDPRHPDLYGYLGDSSLALAEMIEEPMRHARHFDEALAAYRQGIEVCPRDVNLLLGLVNVLDTLKRFDDAEPLIQRAIELDPSSRDVRWALASHLEKCDRLDEAEKEFNRAIELGIGGAGYTALQQIKAKRDAARLKNATPPQAAH